MCFYSYHSVYITRRALCILLFCENSLLKETMGNGDSKPTPPPKKLTDTPWRSLKQSGTSLESTLLADIRSIHPEKNPGVLLIGPVGAGKSSFINSCLSLGAGRKKALAQTGSADTSYTLEFRRYRDSNLLKEFRLMDCMGIEPGYGKGFHPNDIFFLLQGHVKKGYKFDPDKPLTTDNEEFYNPAPAFEDKTHCVVFVVDASVMYNGIPKEYLDKIKWLQTKIKEADIPRVLILTKADRLCEEVQRNKANMFRSIMVKKAVDVASEVFSIEIASIHPVVNYETDFELTTEQNNPILLALRQILQYASDRVEQELNDD